MTSVFKFIQEPPSFPNWTLMSVNMRCSKHMLMMSSGTCSTVLIFRLIFFHTLEVHNQHVCSVLQCLHQNWWCMLRLKNVIFTWSGAASRGSNYRPGAFRWTPTRVKGFFINVAVLPHPCISSPHHNTSLLGPQMSIKPLKSSSSSSLLIYLYHTESLSSVYHRGRCFWFIPEEPQGQ